MKRKIAIIGSFCILASLLLAGICFWEELFPDGKDAAVQPTAFPTLSMFTEQGVMRMDKDNRIEWKDAAEIPLGTKREDVVRRLGLPNEDVGSGCLIDQYQCVNGDYVRIWYGRQESEEWTGFVVESIMIDDEPF